jgi:hypothetical protein
MVHRDLAQLCRFGLFSFKTSELSTKTATELGSPDSPGHFSEMWVKFVARTWGMRAPHVFFTVIPTIYRLNGQEGGK